jgi:hypothetical protein
MQNIGWDTEKHELCNILKTRLLENRTQITYGELLQKKLPSFFRSFLKSQVKRFFEQEKPVQIENSSRYDLQSEEIQKSLALLNEVIQRGTLFSSNEISDAIERTISLQIDYFIKPRTTLERVFYKSKESRSQKELLQAILGISDNRIYIQELIKKLKASPLTIITKSQFTLTAQEVETDVYQKNMLSAFLQDVAVLMEFLGIIQPEGNQKFKARLLSEMLLERNLNDLAERVKSQLTHLSEERLALPEIEKLFRNTQEPAESKANPRTSESKKNSPDSDWQEEIFKSEESDEHPFLNFSEKNEPASHDESDKNGKKTPAVGNKVVFTSGRSQIFGAQEIGSLEPAERETPKIQKPKIIYKGEEKSFSKKGGLFGRHVDDKENITIDRKTIENQPEGPIPSLSTIIDPRNRKILIRKIFKKDEIAYNEFMEKMEATTTWKEAKVIMDTELRQRNVELFSREAIRLGDIIFGRYFPKKR